MLAELFYRTVTTVYVADMYGLLQDNKVTRRHGSSTDVLGVADGSSRYLRWLVSAVKTHICYHEESDCLFVKLCI